MKARRQLPSAGQASITRWERRKSGRMATQRAKNEADPTSVKVRIPNRTVTLEVGWRSGWEQTKAASIFQELAIEAARESSP